MIVASQKNDWRFACKPARLLFFQLQALSKKCYLQRKRNLRVTACEFMSPLIIVGLMIYGFLQSEIVHVSQQKFCAINLLLTEQMVGTLLGNGLLVLLACDLEIQVHCPNISSSLSPFSNPTSDTISNSSLLSAVLTKQANLSTFSLPSQLRPDYVVEDIRTCLAGKDVRQKCQKAVIDYSNKHVLPTPAEQLEALVTLARQFWHLFKGPLIAPPLELYLRVGQFLSKALNQFVGLTPAVQSEVQQMFGNLLNTGSLHLAPRGPMLDSLMVFLKLNYPSFRRTIPIVTHKSEADAVRTFVNDPHLNVWALIVLNDAMKDVRTIDYTIRIVYRQLPSTYDIIDYTSLGFDSSYQQYFLSGFMSLQAAVDEWAFAYKGGKSCVGANLPVKSAALEPFPTYEYTKNDFYTAGGFIIGLVFIIGTFFPFSQMVKILVEDRETGREELMKTMGLSSTLYTLHHLVLSVVIFTYVAFVMTALCCASFFPLSSPSLVFFFLWGFCLSEVTLGYLASLFFRKARLASLAAPVILFTFVLPRFSFLDTPTKVQVLSKYYVSVLSPTALTFGADVLTNYEYAGKGVTWSNKDDGGGFTFGSALSMLYVDFILYFLVACYLAQVIPQKGAGSAKHPLFFLGIKWGGALGGWVGTFDKHFVCCMHTGLKDASIHTFEPDALLSDYMEPVPEKTERLARVCIEDLEMTYPGGKKAVRGLSLKMYESQLTCLLGHNGAGKSTTIGILTGFLTATHGDCLIWGKSISNQLQEVRRDMGVCPQTNILFPFMTVREHLQLFALIKGVPATLRKELIPQCMVEVGLQDKADTFSGSLSGGMKRKLCLAIAFMGNPRFVLLDEPTSGMDPHSRRNIWDLLRKKKEGRVILLTTHFMDEADILADRIAIMIQGKLSCCGSPLFLKNRFGLGYNLTLVLADVNISGIISFITSLIEQHTKGSELLSEAGNELVYRLPLYAVSSFPVLLNELERRGASLNIQGYGISFTTLEEVFLKLGHLGTCLKPDHFSPHEIHEKHFGGKPALFLRQLFSKSLPMQSAPHQPKLPVVVPVVPVDQTADPEKAINFEYPTETKRPTECSERGDSSSRGRDDLDMAGSGGRHILVAEKHEPQIMCLAECSESGDQLSGSRDDLDRAGSGGRHILVAEKQEPQILDNTNIEPEALAVKEAVPQKLFTRSGRLINEACGLSTSEREDWTVKEVSELELDRQVDGYSNPDICSGSGQPLTCITAPATQIDPSHPLQAQKAEAPIIISAAFENNETKESPHNFKEISKKTYDNKTFSDASFVVQFIQLLVKRWHITKRDLKSTASQVVFPAVQIAFIFGLLLIQPPLSGPSILLDASLYGAGTRLIFSGSDKILKALPPEWHRESSVPSTSCEMSDLLLDPTKKYNATGLAEPYGTLVFHDKIPVDIQFFGKGFFNTLRDWVDIAIKETDHLEVRLSTILFFFFNNQPEISRVLQIFGGTSGNQFGLTFSGLNQSDYISMIAKMGVNTANVQGQGQLPSQLLQNGSASSIYGAAFSAYKTVDATQQGPNALPPPLKIFFEDAILSGNTSAQVVTFLDTTIVIGFLNFTVSTVHLKFEDLRKAIPISEINEQYRWKPFATVMHNTSSPHAVAAFANELKRKSFAYCALDMGTHTNTSSNETLTPPQYRVRSHPLPTTARQNLISQLQIAFYAAIFLLIPLSYAPAAFAPFYVMEKARKSHHLQLVSGVGPLAYWISAFVWDILSLSVLNCFIMIVFGVFSQNSAIVFMHNAESAFASAVLMQIYFMANLPLTYILSKGFQNPSNAQVSIMGIHFLTGFCGQLICFVMKGIPRTHKTGQYLANALRIFPAFCVGDGLFNMAASRLREVLAGKKTSMFSWNVTGRPLTYLGVEILAYLCATILIELGISHHFANLYIERLNAWLFAKSSVFEVLKDTDEDVIKETSEVLACEDIGEYAILIRNLFKVYRPQMLTGKCKVAVRGLSVGVPRGQCFGFLGVNGAGKTTTLSILTRDLFQSSGEAYVEGHSTTDSKVHKLIGYCPQVDPLLDLMTAQETLFFYGQIKGIPAAEVSSHVKRVIAQVGLVPLTNVVSGTYSGGNKRKLSLAVALIGDPPVLLLDEPSSGMDPTSRRQMWDTILEVAKNRCVVLTTHSMEECEALCSRVGIMAGGKLRCVGTPQHLKNKFSQGYQVEIKCDELMFPVIKNFMSSTFEGSVLEEISGFKLKFRLSKAWNKKLSAVFSLIESNKSIMRIAEYGITQSSLEQVFINFAKEQEGPSNN